MELSGQQQRAKQAVDRWMEHGTGEQKVFRLFGYAGTGKTTIARQLAGELSGVKFACFTGKAASVLRSKGCPDATTIHSLVYRPRDKSRVRLLELQEKLEQLVDKGLGEHEAANELRSKMSEERESLRQPAFDLNEDSELRGSSLLVLDEVSMVGFRIAHDLLSFEVPILALGDPAQLPPVGDGGFFTNADPDVLLTEVHRQAEGSPVLHLATLARGGGELPLGQYGESAVVVQGSTSLEQVAHDYDQVICGTNRKRHFLNRGIRNVLGFNSVLPEVGDRLIALRNYHEQDVLNGSQWEVCDSSVEDDDAMALLIKERETGRRAYVRAHRHFFEGRESELSPWDHKKALAFDFGYAVTCHKAQGSQWDRVFIVDESQTFGADARRWLYTAVTRAAKRVTVSRKKE